MAARSYSATLPSLVDLKGRIADGSVVSLIERRLRQDDEAPLAALFIQAMEDPSLSLAAFLSTPAFKAVTGQDFWSVQRFLVAVIPKLDKVSPLEMARAVETLARQGGHDGAAGLPFGALRRWLGADLDRARALISAAQGGAELAALSVAQAFAAIADPRATLVHLATPVLREGAVRALAEVSHPTPEDRGALVQALHTAVSGNDDDTFRGLALDALTRAYDTAETRLEGPALALAVNLLRAPGDLTRHRAASLPLAYRNALSSPLVDAILMAVQAVNPEHGGSLSMLGTSLAVLAEDEAYAEAALAFVTDMANRAEGRFGLGLFSEWFQVVRNGPPTRFHRLIVDWLLHGSVALRNELSRHLPSGDLSGRSLTIDFEALALTEPEIHVICCQAVGWFFVHPVTAASVLVSALRSARGALAEALGELLFDPLLVNYAGVRDYLMALAPTDPAHARVQALIARTDRYVADLRSTGDLPELAPSVHERFLERTRMTEEMEAASKASQDQSILAKLFPKTVLLHGRTALISVRAIDGVDRPQEVPMQTISARQELPRRSIADPVGLEWQLLRLRAARVEP